MIPIARRHTSVSILFWVILEITTMCTDLANKLTAKCAQRAADEQRKPLHQYRAEELAMMRRNFYGFDPAYHVARYHFTAKSPQSWTPRHLARHRELDWKVPQ